jgi:hypothetical protein
LRRSFGGGAFGGGTLGSRFDLRSDARGGLFCGNALSRCSGRSLRFGGDGGFGGCLCFDFDTAASANPRLRLFGFRRGRGGFWRRSALLASRCGGRRRRRAGRRRFPPPPGCRFGRRFFGARAFFTFPARTNACDLVVCERTHMAPH